jgi:hypothetical protein
MPDVGDRLGTDFEGQQANPQDVIDAGLDDARHQERVQPLTAVLEDAGSPAEDRLLACIALVSWAERAGYSAVVSAARRPDAAPWYKTRIDRLYGVDSTFADLASAVDLSYDLAEVKGTLAERTEALRALVRIADREYFGGQLEYALDETTVAMIVDDIEATVRAGIERLSAGDRPGFDIISQLVDLAGVLATGFEELAVELGTELVNADSSPRVLRHAMSIVARGRTEVSRTFGEYLSMLGDEDIRRGVVDALKSR